MSSCQTIVVEPARRYEPESIWVLLVHLSIRTTTRYLWCMERLRIAVNDHAGSEPDSPGSDYFSLTDFTVSIKVSELIHDHASFMNPVAARVSLKTSPENTAAREP